MTFPNEENLRPELKIVPGFFVSGLTIRTTNCDELQPAKAKIPLIWKEFIAKEATAAVEMGSPGSAVFGVYSNHCSDASGAYDLTVGRSIEKSNVAGQHVKVLGGKYFVFRESGAMPEAIVRAWAAVWTYFAQNPQVKRNYVSDFEYYSGPEEVSVHIGVE